MFAGHFGLAAAVKSRSPGVPLWGLMLATQLLDVIFVPLYLTGIETMEPIGDNPYGGSVIHADYSHSLVGALLIALLAGDLAARYWQRRGGWIIALTVFSHWLLDLLVHRADLPILPGNWGHLPLLGFGLWRYPHVSMAVELLLIAIGCASYFRYLLAGATGRTRGAAVSAGVLMGFLLAAALGSDVLGLG